MRPQQLFTNKVFLEAVSLVLVILAVALPRAPELDRFVTPDEHLWLTRSANFYEALAHKNWAAAFQSAHPGVTIMWAGAAGFIWEFPAYPDFNRGQVDPDTFDKFMERRSRPASPLEILRAARFVLVLVHTTVLAIGYLYARRLLGILPAFLGFMVIAFDPFHLALTRLLHLDGLMANFILLSLLAFLNYLRDNRRLDLLVSGAAAGLSWLTKSPALFLAPVIGWLVLMGLWKASRQQALSWKLVWKYAGPGLAWVISGVLVFIAIWPAMWVAPLQVITQVLGSAQEYAEVGHASALFFNG